MNLRTDFTDGDVFYSGTTADDDKLNGITNEVNRKGVIHRKVYSSAAEVSNSGSGWQDTAKTFNLSAPVNSLILQVNVWCQVKNSSTGVSQIGLKISGTNLGTKYLVATVNEIMSADRDSRGDCILSDTEANSTATAPINKKGDYTTEIESFRTLQPIKVLDSSTAFTFRIRFDSTGTASLKNVNCEIIYIENFTEDA